MGSFYTNYTVLSTDSERVKDTMSAMGRRSLVTPAQQGSVVVYDAASEGQDPDVIERLASSLAHEMIAPVIATLIHDDDLLMLWIVMPRGLSASYGKTYDAPIAAFELARVSGRWHLLPLLFLTLANPFYLFESMRHRRIVRLCGFNSWAIGTGYQYLMKNEFPDGLTKEMLLDSGSLGN